MAEVDFTTSGRLDGPLTLGMHDIGGVIFAKSVITDPVTGNPITYPTASPVIRPNETLHEITIPSGTATGVYATYDMDGYESVWFQVDSGSNIDLRPRFNENGNGTPPTARIQQAQQVNSYPIAAFINSTGLWVAKVAGRYMQLNVNAIPSADVVLKFRGSQRPAPEADGGSKVGFVRTGAAGNALAAACQLVGCDLINTNAAIRFFHVFSTASTPTVGAGTIVYTIPLPPGVATHKTFRKAIPLGSGCGWTITTDVAGTLTGASGDIVGSLELL